MTDASSKRVSTKVAARPRRDGGHGPSGPKSQRYAEARENIVDVSAQLFAKNGYSATGVAQIGDAAGLARGALYYYIESKESLLAAIHDRVIDPLLDEAEKINTVESDPVKCLIMLSERLMRQVVERHEHVWVFLHEYEQLRGEDRARFQKKRREFEAFILGFLQNGIDQGVLVIDNIRLAMLAFLNLHNYTYQWIAHERGLSVEEISAFYVRLYFNGIASTDVDLERLIVEVHSAV